MLKYAQIYKDKLQEQYLSIILRDEYKFYNNGSYWDNELELSKDTWESLDFVSVDDEDDVIGFFSGKISRTNDKIAEIAAISFTSKGNYVFSKDFYNFIKDIFLKYNFRKIEFSVVIGNPIEKMFDKFITVYGGVIVGIKRLTVKLHDNIYYDNKHYELFREMFIENMKKRWKATR